MSLAAADGDGVANDVVLTPVRINLGSGSAVVGPAALTGSPQGNLVAVTADAARGYAGGRWDGSLGLVSSAATADPGHRTTVGVILNAATPGSATPLYPTFDGQPAAATDVLAAYTYYGDANLDGKVDGQDYARIDAGYASRVTAAPLSGWYNGDFNYDGRIDGSDYTLIDNAFNLQSGSLDVTAIVADRTAEVAAAVPEPAAVGIVTAGAAGAIGRRRRRRA